MLGGVEQARGAPDELLVRLRHVILPVLEVLLEALPREALAGVEIGHRFPVPRLLLEQRHQRRGHDPVQLFPANVGVELLSVPAIPLRQRGVWRKVHLLDSLVGIVLQVGREVLPVRIRGRLLPRLGHPPQHEQRGRLANRLLEPLVGLLARPVVAENVAELVRELKRELRPMSALRIQADLVFPLLKAIEKHDRPLVGSADVDGVQPAPGKVAPQLAGGRLADPLDVLRRRVSPIAARHLNVQTIHA